MLLRLLGNAYMSQKIDHKLFLLVPPTQKFSTGFYHHPQGRGKLLIFPQFFKNLSSLAEEAGLCKQQSYLYKNLKT